MLYSGPRNHPWTTCTHFGTLIFSTVLCVPLPLSSFQVPGDEHVLIMGPTSSILGSDAHFRIYIFTVPSALFFGPGYGNFLSSGTNCSIFTNGPCPLLFSENYHPYSCSPQLSYWDVAFYASTH